MNSILPKPNKKPGKNSINEFINDYDYLIDEFDKFIVDFFSKNWFNGWKYNLS